MSPLKKKVSHRQPDACSSLFGLVVRKGRGTKGKKDGVKKEKDLWRLDKKYKVSNEDRTKKGRKKDFLSLIEL